jgi:hypothetical protein
VKVDDFTIWRPADGPTTLACPARRCRGIEIEDGTTIADAIAQVKQHIRNQHPNGR